MIRRLAARWPRKPVASQRVRFGQFGFCGAVSAVSISLFSTSVVFASKKEIDAPRTFLSGNPTEEKAKLHDAQEKSSIILRYWFGDDFPTSVDNKYALWFDGTPDIDRDIKKRFAEDVERALQGHYDYWMDLGPKECLALIILLDQFSLNIFRDLPEGYHASKRAIPLTYTAIGRGYLNEMPTFAKMFFLLPLEHSELLIDQEESVKQHRAFGVTDEYAIVHRDIVAKYGRFPGRNKVHGRKNTPEEEQYLKDGGIF